MNEFGVWQPIETAPKDGTEILVSGWFKNRAGEKQRWIDVAVYAEGDWYDAVEGRDGDMFLNVTHWMPLPEPPAL